MYCVTLLVRKTSKAKMINRWQCAMHAIQYTVYMHNFAHARIYERAFLKKCANMTPKNFCSIFNMGSKNAEYSAGSNLLNSFKNAPK